MKKLISTIFICSLLALGSCSVPMGHATYYIDYKEAGQGKVFISEANSVSFEYEPIGSIVVVESSGVVKTTVPTTEKERSSDALYGPGPSTKTVSRYSQATAQTALNYAAQQALLLGGDGIINLQLSTEFDKKGEKVETVTVTGMVIKRK